MVGCVFGLARISSASWTARRSTRAVLEHRVQERTRELSERQQDLERVNHELAQASVTPIR